MVNVSQMSPSTILPTCTKKNHEISCPLPNVKGDHYFSNNLSGYLHLHRACYHTYSFWSYTLCLIRFPFPRAVIFRISFVSVVVLGSFTGNWIILCNPVFAPQILYGFMIMFAFLNVQYFLTTVLITANNQYVMSMT